MTINEAVRAAIAEWRAQAAADGIDETAALRAVWEEEIEQLVFEAMDDAGIIIDESLLDEDAE